MPKRTVKFRAWDEKEKKWLDYFGLDQYGCVLEHVFAGFGPLEKFLNEDAILQQYTGLKDSDGKDIYDGDIIAFQQNEPQFDLVRNYIGHAMENKYAVVFWNDDNARFDTYNADRQYSYGYDFHSGLTNRAKVCGNIFENPELIK